MKFKNELDFLHAQVIGKRTSETIKEATKEICEACIKNQCSKVLVDVRDFTQRVNAPEIFSLASIELPDIIQHKITKVTIVDLEGFEDKTRFFEGVARFWGHNVQIFTDINNAVQWLR